MLRLQPKAMASLRQPGRNSCCHPLCHDTNLNHAQTHVSSLISSCQIFQLQQYSDKYYSSTKSNDYRGFVGDKCWINNYTWWGWICMRLLMPEPGQKMTSYISSRFHRHTWIHTHKLHINILMKIILYIKVSLKYKLKKFFFFTAFLFK